MSRGKPAPLSPAARAALAYHERSKHHPGRYARAMGFLDWENQPDPYRRWTGTELISLARPAWDPAAGRTAESAPRAHADLPDDATIVRGDMAAGSSWPRASYDALYHAGAVPPRPLDAVSLSALFWNSMALSATKSVESARWSLRVNPSSGNLHPTEAWLLLDDAEPLGGAGPGLFHYAPREHALERRADYAATGQAFLGMGRPAGSALVALSSIPWREAWKYGERAWRYCQHDAGHALAALRLSAALLGWRLSVLPDVDDGLLSRLLGLDREDAQNPGEPEHAELLMLLETRPLIPTPLPTRGAKGRSEAQADPAAWVPAATDVAQAVNGRWHGRAAPLSPDDSPVDWPVLGEVERACRKTPEWCERTRLFQRPVPPQHAPLPDLDADVPDAESVLRTRRSAVAMDGRTGLTQKGFYDMLLRCQPGGSPHPWDATTWSVGVHLGLFVHRIADLESGFYMLVRDPSALAALQADCDPDFVWSPAPQAPAGLSLFLLRAADTRNTAAGVSCGQDIAADGAFAVAMLADVAGALALRGAPAYRHLFWETGVLGQVLYLEARAHGVSATGIGCFFDDPTQRLFGLSGRRFQSLYHFTVGGAVDDDRLVSEPAYPG